MRGPRPLKLPPDRANVSTPLMSSTWADDQGRPSAGAHPRLSPPKSAAAPSSCLAGADDPRDGDGVDLRPAWTSFFVGHLGRLRGGLGRTHREPPRGGLIPSRWDWESGSTAHRWRGGNGREGPRRGAAHALPPRGVWLGIGFFPLDRDPWGSLFAPQLLRPHGGGPRRSIAIGSTYAPHECSAGKRGHSPALRAERGVPRRRRPGDREWAGSLWDRERDQHRSSTPA